MAADGVVPDVRDGLTPVCRRVLRALSADLRGSTRIVDAVLRSAPRRDGGRRAIYGELVRMARDWELRHPLVDAEGDLGSLNGDGAAGAEYTRMRLAPAGAELLGGAQRGAGDPPVLPAAFPNLLVNGSFSLATGSASRIPPHNLREVAAAAIAFVDDPRIDAGGLMRHVAGPDFPTGGAVAAGDGLRAAYESGRGEIAVRARAHVEPGEPGAHGDAIVVSELPFMVSTGGRDGVLAEISRAARSREITGIARIDDRSDEREGLRIVISLAAGAASDRVLEQLFAQTQLERPYRIALVASDDGGERTLSLRDLVERHVEHRRAELARRDAGSSAADVARLVREELLEVAERHGDARRTEIL